MIPGSRRRAVALACTLAAGTCCLAQDSSATSPDCCRIQEPNAAAVTPGSCKGLDACMAALIAAAEPGPGISSKGQAASKAVLAFGDAAVPALLPLLKNENRDVRDLASYTLRDAPVTEEHLDALIASRLTGDGWIAPAIARIGSPRAIEFLVSELPKEPENGTQLTWAFEVLGVKGVPYLAQLYDCSPQCDEKVLAVGAYIFSELGDKAKAAIEPLLAIAEDARRDRTVRRGAIQASGLDRTLCYARDRASQGDRRARSRGLRGVSHRSDDSHWGRGRDRGPTSRGACAGALPHARHVRGDAVARCTRGS